jgi:hypothetical protein
MDGSGDHNGWRRRDRDRRRQCDWTAAEKIYVKDIRLIFSKPDIEIPGGSEKKTGQTVHD